MQGSAFASIAGMVSFPVESQGGPNPQASAASSWSPGCRAAAEWRLVPPEHCEEQCKGQSGARQTKASENEFIAADLKLEGGLGQSGH
jgi:hypothetical protein